MDRNNDVRRTALICALLCVLTFASFWPVLHNGFINFDDPVYVTQNPHVLSGLSWDNLVWAFRTGHASNWHPVTWISHMLDAQLYGSNPAGHHISSVLLHTLTAVLLFLVLRGMTGATWRSAFVAALFALHPTRVESVVWISERKDVLSAFFFMLTLLAYLRYVRSDPELKPSASPQSAGKPANPRVNHFSNRAYYALALATFALGLMSKPMLVTLPFLLLLLDYWPLQRFASRPADSSGHPFPFAHSAVLFREKIPFFVLAIVTSTITFWVQRNQGVVAPGGLPLESRVANAALSYVRYLGMAVWPSNLALYYPHPASWRPELAGWATWKLGAAALVFLLLTIVAIRSLRQRPYLAVGWFWYVGMLVPVIGLVQVGSQAMADRYTYLPLIGIFVAVTWSLAELAARPWAPWGATLAAFIALSACCALTFSQASRWKSSLTIFEHTLKVTTDNATAQSNYAAALEEAGELDGAVEHYREALRLDPSDESFYNLGHGLATQGKLAEAAEAYQDALRLNPTHVLAHNNLATVFHAQGKYEQAANEYQEALRLQPGFAQGHYNLAKLLADSGDFPGAETEYRTTLQLRPDHGPAQIGLGLALAAQERFKEAVPFLQRTALTLSNSPAAQMALANALLDAGDAASARKYFNEAMRLDPDLLTNTLQSAHALAQQAQPGAAISRYLQALRLSPGHAEMHEQLGILMAQAGLTNEALTNFYEAVRLSPSPQAHCNLALALVLAGKAKLAVTEYEQALLLEPNRATAMNDLAWILATHPESSIRNGTQAVKLAEAACRLDPQQARFWGTLDAAYAESGRFEDAIATAERAAKLATSQGLNAISEAAQERLKRYRTAQPFRQGSAASNGAR